MDKLKNIPLIRIFSIIILFLFALWLLLFVIGDCEQARRFTLRGAMLFSDFLDPIDEAKDFLAFEILDQERMMCCYAPVVYFFFNIVQRMVSNGGFANSQTILYLFVSYYLSVISVILVILNFKTLCKHKYIDKILFSFAVLASGVYIHSFERANVIFSVLLFIYYFILFYKSENKFLKESALISISFAIAFKISPVAFLLLLFFEKDFKAIKRVICYSLILFIFPSLAFPRGIESISSLIQNLNLYSSDMDSTVNLGKLVVYNFLDSIFKFKDISVVIRAITIVFTLMCSFSAFVSFFQKPLWKKVLPLSLLLIIVPSVSHGYNALYLIPPLTLYFADDTKKGSDYLYLLWFVLIFNIIVFIHPRVLIDIGITGCVLQLFISSIREFDFKSYCKIFKEYFDKKFFIDLAKLGACLALSLSILALGIFAYNKTYHYADFQIDKTSPSKSIQTTFGNLDEDYKIEIKALFNLKDFKEEKIVFSTTDNADGFKLKVNKDSSLEFLYKNKKGEILGNSLKSLKNGLNYKFNAVITEKSVSYLLEEEYLYNMGSYDEYDFAYSCQTVHPKSIDKISVDNSVNEFKLSLKNGKNADWIIVLSLILSLLPLLLI